MKTRFIAITGVKKAGKTTTIEYLIPKIIAKGYKVGVAKIAYKPVSIDVNQEHYDVIRLRKAKPTKTLFKSKIETTIFFEDELTLRQALSEFGKGLDIVLLEGFPDDFIGFPQIAILKDNTEINDVKNEFTVALSSIPEFSLKITDPLFIEFSTLDT
ncbi:MAG: molybdopterin-guanine dinucleotide biosynthesis protein B, partial [Candidatus Thorarchaeota archaeon]